MTTVELMDNLADYLRSVIVDYSTQQPSGKRNIKVYAGYPPAREIENVLEYDPAYFETLFS